jgi:hypothetical protein
VYQSYIEPGYGYFWDTKSHQPKEIRFSMRLLKPVLGDAVSFKNSLSYSLNLQIRYPFTDPAGHPKFFSVNRMINPLERLIIIGLRYENRQIYFDDVRPVDTLLNAWVFSVGVEF